MKSAEDLLLYPLLTGDEPVCPRCSSPLALVGFHGERGKPDFSRFRCPACGRSETFAEDDDRPAPEVVGDNPRQAGGKGA
jgi:transposase-like protein